MATITVPDFMPSMEAQSDALRANAIAVTKWQIGRIDAEIAELRAERAKQRKHLAKIERGSQT